MINFRRKHIVRRKTYHKLAVAGITRGVGATHFSILLGNYYSEVLGRKTAIVDLNEDCDYEFLKQICTPDGLINNNVYNIHKVVYYQSVTRENLAGIFHENYECVILDVGSNYRKFINEISMCDRKYMISSIGLWKVPGVVAGLNEVQFNEQWKFLYCFGDKESADYISECTGRRLYPIPVINNPFKITGRQLMEVERILEA